MVSETFRSTLRHPPSMRMVNRNIRDTSASFCLILFLSWNRAKPIYKWNWATLFLVLFLFINFHFSLTRYFPSVSFVRKWHACGNFFICFCFSGLFLKGTQLRFNVVFGEFHLNGWGRNLRFPLNQLNQLLFLWMFLRSKYKKCNGFVWSVLKFLWSVE